MRHDAKELIFPGFREHACQSSFRLRHELAELINYQVVRCALGEVVRPGQRRTFHPHGEKTAEQSSGISVRDGQIHDEAAAGVDEVPERQPVLKRPETVAKDWGERQEIGTLSVDSFICASSRPQLSMRRWKKRMTCSSVTFLSRPSR